MIDILILSDELESLYLKRISFDRITRLAGLLSIIGRLLSRLRMKLVVQSCCFVAGGGFGDDGAVERRMVEAGKPGRAEFAIKDGNNEGWGVAR